MLINIGIANWDAARFREYSSKFFLCVVFSLSTLRPQLHDTGFVSERHQFKVFSSLVSYYNFLYMKFLFKDAVKSVM